MVPGSAVGRSLLSTRFTARMRVAAMGYPSAEQLQGIYSALIQQVGVWGKIRAACWRDDAAAPSRLEL